MAKVRYVWWLFLVGSLFAQVPRSIYFDKLNNWIENSPTHKGFVSIRDLATAQQLQALSWTDPYISYALESVGDQTESITSLNQTIQLPWYRSLLRKEWRHRISSAELQLEMRSYSLHSQLRKKYIALYLAREVSATTVHLRQSSQQLKDASRVRREEGILSEVNEALISWTHDQIQDIALQWTIAAKRIESELLNLTGLITAEEIHLGTVVEYYSFNLPSEIELISFWRGGAMMQASEFEISAGEMALKAAKRGAFSEITLQGGTKNIAGENPGFAFGLSIPLPLLGQNRAVKHLRLRELDLARIEFDVYQRNTISQIKQLYLIIGELDSLLSETPPQTEDEQSIESLQSSYQEGWLSLPDYLSALQIRAASLEAYYGQLTDYYSSIIQLEDLTGKRFLVFNETRKDNQL